jgi:hypothetical protein
MREKYTKADREFAMMQKMASRPPKRSDHHTRMLISPKARRNLDLIEARESLTAAGVLNADGTWRF